MDSATRLLEMAVHCLDESDWPFSVAEVLARPALQIWTLEDLCPLPMWSLRRLLLRNRVEFVAAATLGCRQKRLAATRVLGAAGAMCRTVRLHAHQDEHAFDFQWQRALRFDFPSSCVPAQQADDAGSVCRTLDRPGIC